MYFQVINKKLEVVLLNNILQEVANKEKLLQQAEELKKKKFSPGFDGMTAEKAYVSFFIRGEIKLVKA